MKPFNSTVKAKIDSIDNFGLVKVSFNRTVNNKFNWTRDLNTSNIDIWLKPANDWHLQIEGGYNMTNFNFTWNITEFNNTKMDIQLNFTGFPEVSVTNQYDHIVLNFLRQDVITSLNGDPLSNSSLWLTNKIPKQIELTPANR